MLLLLTELRTADQDNFNDVAYNMQVIYRHHNILVTSRSASNIDVHNNDLHEGQADDLIDCTVNSTKCS